MNGFLWLRESRFVSLFPQPVVIFRRWGMNFFIGLVIAATFRKKNMKTHIFSKILILTLFISAGAAAQGTLTVTVKNIKDTKGTIRVGLFNSENDFLKKAVEGKVVKVTGTEVTVVFQNLKPGEYSVSVIHDENENGELDTNMMGIPKEGFAFGNNAMGMFGPPSYDKAKVSVADKSTVTQSIDLKYL
jgi:uncharacterized protein (DUF2141 family)